MIIECAPNQENSKRIVMKNDFEFIGESDGCSVFKRKLINKIKKGGKVRNWKLGGDEAA